MEELTFTYDLIFKLSRKRKRKNANQAKMFVELANNINVK